MFSIVSIIRYVSGVYKAFFFSSSDLVIFINFRSFSHNFCTNGNTVSMREKIHLPDFRKRCLPGQFSYWGLASLLIFYFFFASVGGFLWEVLLLWLKEGLFVKRGFLYGPWLPVYGIGAVLFYVLLIKKRKHPITVFLLAALIGSGLELAIGWFLDTVFKMRYWDYSSTFLNFHGYICIWSALGFAIAGTLWICLLSDRIKNLWFHLPLWWRRTINTLLALLFVIDCTAALIFPNKGPGVTF